MTDFVVDASVAVKLAIEENDSRQAVRLRTVSHLFAPDLIWPECANILWKKWARGELILTDVDLAIRLLRAASPEVVPSEPLTGRATRLAIALSHPAYDCFYLAAASLLQCPFVTSDARLFRKIRSTALQTEDLPDIMLLSELPV